MEKMQDEYEYHRKLEKNYKTEFKNNNAVTPENQEKLKKFFESFHSGNSEEDRGVETIKKNVSMFKTILKEFAHEDFQIHDASKDELKAIVKRINESEKSSLYKADLKGALRNYYKYMESDTKKIPNKVDFISTRKHKGNKEHPRLLTKKEIEKFFRELQNDRDIAMYRVLYEAGLRPGELMALRVGDVEIREEVIVLHIPNVDHLNSKCKLEDADTYREFTLIESKIPLETWLDKHPFRNVQNAPLWTKLYIKNPEEKNPFECRIKPSTMRKKLKRKGEKARIRIVSKDGKEKSNMIPTWFRRRRATELAAVFSEGVQRRLMGWVEGSDMPSYYSQLNHEIVRQRYKEYYGLEKKNFTKPYFKTCPSCHHQLFKPHSYCTKCGEPIEEENDEEENKQTDSSQNSWVIPA